MREAPSAGERHLSTRARSIPAARIRRLATPPVVGAALIGLDRLAGGTADPEAEARIRAALDDWNATPRVVTPS